MSAGPYALEPVSILGAPARDRIRRIYEDGFPSHLRADFDALVGDHEHGEFALALMRGPQPCGFAMLRSLGPTGWVFLRYFVVDSQQQGQGLGGIMWDHLTARLGANGGTLLIFDVEDPDEPGCPAAERQVRQRRIAFYRRHGASVLPATGYQTPGHGDEQGWTPMLLLTAPLLSGQPVTTADQASAVVRAVYRYRWRLSPEHPQVSAVEVSARPPGGELRRS